MVEKSMLEPGEVVGSVAADPYAQHVDCVGTEKATTEYNRYGCPGTLGQEFDNGGYNNIWDDSYPVDRTPRPVAGNRGGGHPGQR